MKILWERLGGRSGHEAGRTLLETLYGGPLPEIRYMERGKPYFADSPLHFSISHTPRHAVCVLSERPVGVDCEELDRNINLALAEKILSPSELQQFRQAEDPRRALLTFWVLKEASVKCSGEGLRGYPNHTAFSLDDPRVQETDGCLIAIIEE